MIRKTEHVYSIGKKIYSIKITFDSFMFGLKLRMAKKKKNDIELEYSNKNNGPNSLLSDDVSFYWYRFHVLL